jgi:hypothetical protein
MPNYRDLKLERAAHHEAGHLVVAAAKKLRLRPEGLGLDPRGEGLACYYKQPDTSELSRERIIVAMFAGYYAEMRFCQEGAYLALAPDSWFPSSLDGQDADKLLREITGENLSNQSAAEIQRELRRQSEQLVERHWLAIKAVANVLMSKDWEPLKPLKSGGIWSIEATAKYVTGDEVVRVLGQQGIVAICDPNC